MAFTDAFTDTNGTTLSTHDATWVKETTGAMEIQSNGLTATSGTTKSIYRYNQTFAAAHYSKAVYSSSAVGGIGPAVRCQTGASSCYYCLADGSAVFNGQAVAGTFTDWDSGVTGIAATDVIELSIDSSTTTTVYFKKNSSIAATYTSKNALSSGQAGVTRFNGTTGRIDDWEGGDVAAAGIAFDAASNSTYQTAQSTYSWSHTCTGADRYLKVGISMLSVGGSSVSGITYNSIALTLLGAIASVSGAVRAELWGLVAPATGSNTIAVTLSASLDSAGCATSFTGVHQTSPVEGFNSASATNVGAADATVNVTTVADNDWVVDQVASDDTAITVGAGQTQRNNVTGTLGSGADSTEGPKTPAGSVTMSWTNVAALATWSTTAVALRPTAASSLGRIGKLAGDGGALVGASRGLVA